MELLFDTIACAVVGSSMEPAIIAARMARHVQSDRNATVFAYGMKTSPEVAALTNTMMVRTNDYNDCFTNHPSDMTAGILAAGEIAHSSGPEVLGAIAMAYEIGNCIGVGFGGGGRAGFDSPFIGLAVALATGRLWGFDESQLANAASLAFARPLPRRCALGAALDDERLRYGVSTRNGVYAAMLAQEGFTGPSEPFEGIRGYFHITGPLEVHLPAFPGDRSIIEMTGMKPLPAENNTIGTLELIEQNRDWLTADTLESMEIEVAGGLDVHLGDELRYDPKNRETADHSFPYMIARSLVDGQFDFDTFTPERIADPAIRPLMRRITVSSTQEMTDLRDRIEPPRLLPTRVKLRTKDGRTLDQYLPDHSGWATRTEVSRDIYNRKLDLCARGLPDEQREQVRRPGGTSRAPATSAGRSRLWPGCASFRSTQP